MKKIIKLVVITIALFISQNAFGEDSDLKWEKEKVFRVVDNENFVLYDGRTIHIIGINSPDLFHPEVEDQCLSKKIHQTLKTLLEDKEVKILESKTKKTKNGRFSRHVKLENGDNLTEFLLEQGFTRFKSDETDTRWDKKYIKAEELAKKNKSGLWGGCNTEEIQEKIRLAADQRTLDFRNKYGQFYAPISTGKVTKVFSGNSFELENGLRIKMLGILAPDPTDKRAGFACFGRLAQAYLEELILGKTVFLEKDNSQINDEYELQRYVFLEGKIAHDRIFVNEKMVQEGFAKSNWDTKDSHFKNEIEAAQESVYQNPTGAWYECVQDIITPEKETKELVYDTKCPIKGNISSKGKTYHTPASGWYKRIKYERCFDTEESAIAAGFKKVK